MRDFLPTSWTALALTLLATGAAAAPEPVMPGGAQDFAQRCAEPGVILCDPLDDSPVRGVGVGARTRNLTLPDALSGKYRDWRWCRSVDGVRPATPAFDREVKASGGGSVRFTVPGRSAANAAGFCQINFTPDNSVQFGEGETFFVQYRVRFSCELLYTDCNPSSPGYRKERRRFAAKKGSTAFKVSIINAGDHADLEYPVDSCTNQEIVLMGPPDGAITGYHSCGWYDGHTYYLGLNRATGMGLDDRQPIRKSRDDKVRGCYNIDPASGTKLTSTWKECLLWEPDEWFTVTQQVSIGQWADKVKQPGPNSNVRVWVSRAGKPYEKVIDYDRNLRRPEKPMMKYGKVWLIPYFTGKDPDEEHPAGHMWFDELIVSRHPIAPAR